MKNFCGIFAFLCAAAFVCAATDPRLEQGARFAAVGNYDKALGEYRAMLAENPHNAKAYFAAAEVRFKMKDFSGAVANYRLAYQWAPDMVAAYEGAAKSFERLGDKTSAANERKKMPQIPDFDDGKKEDASEQKADAKAEEKTEEKKADAKSSDSRFSYSSPVFEKARKLFNSKDYKASGSAFRDVLAKEPGNPGAYYFAGVGRYELGELDKAEYNLKNSFDFPELGYNAHYYLSLIYKKENKKDLEKAELEAYVKLSTNKSAVEKAKARIAELGGKPAEEKKADFPQETKPQEAANLAASESSSVKESTDVGEMEKSSSSPAPAKKTEGSLDLANQAYKLGNYSSALSLYHEVLNSLKDDDSKSYVLLQMGNIYRNRRDYRSAVAKYRESVEMYPNSEWASESQRAWEDAVWQEKNAAALPRK